jgi:citrate synthase
MSDWLSAQEVMERLNIRSQTLYAYVSRGRIEARAQADDPRKSLYRTADIVRLEARKARGRKAAAVAQETIAFGEPILASAITTIQSGNLFYRGRNAVGLSQTLSLEAVTLLLLDVEEGSFGPRRPVPLSGATGKARVFSALGWAASEAAPSRGRHLDLLHAEALQILNLVADAVVGHSDHQGLIHQRLAHAWGCDEVGADLLRWALVLLADHELNASTFAARVTASTGASLAGALLAGFCALSGPLHGGMAARVRSFMDEAARVGIERTLQISIERAVTVPGFYHPLYPEGDPRAKALLEVFVPPADYQAVFAATEAATGKAPNIDFALAALASTLNLPEDAPFLLFAMARCAGWLAHAIEQVRTGTLIRPRALYIGPRLQV